MELKRILIPMAALFALGTACSDGGVAPPAAPTALRVDLKTPHADDGALVITLRGPGMSNLAPASSGYLVYTRVTSPQETRVIVVGDLKAGALLTLDIASGHPLADYSASIQQAAARTDVLREDLRGYEVSVTVP